MKALDKEKNKIKPNKASFLKKLFEILKEPLFNKYIRWSRDGFSFIIVDEKLFLKKVMPKYWTHDNFASFHRQLNLYNFKKLKTENGEHKYEHEEFNKYKDIKEIELIKKKVKNKKEKENNFKKDIKENNIEENKIIGKNNYLENFENLDENVKINICENIIKNGELSKNENKVLLMYLLDKNKESINTIKNLQNEIKIINDKNNILMEQLKQFGTNYYYSQNKNQKIRPDIQSLNINKKEEILQPNDNSLDINYSNNVEKYINKYYDFSNINNYNLNNNNIFNTYYNRNFYNNNYKSNYNSNSLKSSQKSENYLK